MQLVYDIKSLEKLVVARISTRYGFSIRFDVYNYKNIVSIGSQVSNDRHVIFGDFEKNLTKRQEERIRNVMLKNNCALICFFKSSKGKYHFISPQVYDWLDVIRISKEIGSEKNYLSLSAVRQEFILRVSKKGRKDEPKLVKVFYNKFADKNKILFSKGHSHFLNMFYGLDKSFLEPYKKVGNGMLVEKYRTTNL